MEVTVYTRHTAGCPHIKDRYSRRCQCRKWFDYFRNGKQIRESAKTRNWDTAVKLARKIEREYDDRRLGIVPTPEVGTTTIEDAVAAYIRKISDPKEGREASTLRKPKRMTNLLVEFSDRWGLTYLSELTPMLLEEWRTSWTFDSNGQSLRIHDHIARAFFPLVHGDGFADEKPLRKAKQIQAKEHTADDASFPRRSEEATRCNPADEPKRRGELIHSRPDAVAAVVRTQHR
jgi:hypothetical protein